MPVYEYIALDDRGHRLKGIVDAASAAGARQKLRETRIFPIDLKESSARQSENAPARKALESLSGKVTEATTLQRGKVRIDGTKSPIRYGSADFGANVAGAAISASNGNIIPVDALPIPVFDETTPPPGQ